MQDPCALGLAAPSTPAMIGHLIKNVDLTVEVSEGFEFQVPWRLKTVFVGVD